MKFIKFLTRKYTLLEHDLICRSVIGKSSVQEVYYNEGFDISKEGLIDIHIPLKDLEDNKNRVRKAVEKDADYINKRLTQGFKALENLSNIPSDFLNKIGILSDKEIINQLEQLKRKIIEFGGYFDFTHHLGASGVNLTDEQLRQLSKFHEGRKKIFLDYFKFIDLITIKIAEKKKVKSGNLEFLNFNEIICLLESKLKPEKADELQKKRRKEYVMIMKPSGFKVISEPKEIKEFIRKIKEDIVEEERDEIKGLGINSGKTQGEVKLVTQTTPLREIESGKIIVTQMTHPDMTPMLKKVKAIITDEGGLLCHTANIAREFGILAIIGTKNATRLLKDGDIIELDADKGVVRKI
jgi:phosphoenolpyruvate synthase/pyruvate phosphate dikinase